MSASDPHTPAESAEEPLDPAMERVRRKLTMLLLVSAGVMGLCFVIVMAAVFYRLSQGGTAAPAAVVDLPVAADELTSVQAADDLVTFTIGGGNPRVEVRRLPDGALVSTFRLTGPGSAAQPDE